MTPALSAYLDLARFLAAISVMLSHLWPMVRPESRFAWPGHEVVIVFFVLSGTMMAYVTERRPAGLRDYALDRLARLWSVALPALFLGAAAAWQFGDFASMHHPAADPHGVPASAIDVMLRSLANGVFVGQSWVNGGGVLAPNNGPFWSLQYEAWYYWIFGAWHFLRGPWRLPVVAVLALMAGPTILLLLPCWLVGVAVWRYRARLVLPDRVAGIMLVATLLMFSAYCAVGANKAIYQAANAYLPLYRLGFSNEVIGDTLLSLLVGANFIAACGLGRSGRWLVALAVPIRMAASATLTIYLFHLPITFLLLATMAPTGWALLVLVAIPLAPLALLTEARRPALRRLLARLVPGGADNPSAALSRTP